MARNAKGQFTPKRAVLASFNTGPIDLPNMSKIQNAANDITTGGYITGKKVGVFAYISSPAATTVTTAGTYYPIQGTFVNDPIEDFGIAVDEIEYLGKQTQYFEVDWHATIRADKAETTTIGIKKNGVIFTPSLMSLFTKVANENYTFSGTSVIPLSTGDTIQLVLTSDENGALVTLSNFTTTITEFFD